jgi:two-component system chemotaxis response regulator CheY
VEKKILIIDDSSTVRQQVRAALATAGFEVIEAADGIEAAEIIAERKDVDAVLCDVNMPRMGGIEMLELVQAKGQLNGVPVVMLTTEGQQALVQRAKQAGARGWIVKPFKPEQLVATMRKLTART